MKMKIRERIAQEIVEMELFHTYIKRNGEKSPMYEELGYDKEKIEAEGSAWIVYVYDCMRDYYERNKERIEREVDEILIEALVEGGRVKQPLSLLSG